MTAVLVGGPDAAAAAPLLTAAGLSVRVLGASPAEELAAADRSGLRYTLIHVGAADVGDLGSHARAHHRVSLGQVAALAERLRPRERRLVTCLAFAYKQGVPDDAAWLIDVRFLDNPYWVEALRPLTGRDAPVAEYVLAQPAAVELLNRLEPALRWVIPLYQRDRLTIAFGCTGGRHRSVALAAEMARRLGGLEGTDVEMRARDLEA